MVNNSPSESCLTFKVIGRNTAIPDDARSQAFLIRDDWDDWAKYCTQFHLKIVSADGATHVIGNVKIGQYGLKPHVAGEKIPKDHRRPKLPSEFEFLGESFFSLGQEEQYYLNLTELGDSFREDVLRRLNDVAFNPKLWSKSRNENVMGESLLRFVTPTSVEGQYSRLAHGLPRSTRYRFAFTPPKRMGGGEPPYSLEFEVIPDSMPPTNVHVLIGRNGVGKTRLLALMTKALVASSASAKQSGNFLWALGEGKNRFANLVTVSFSAFDDAELFPKNKVSDYVIDYSHIGLHRMPSPAKTLSRPKSPRLLANEFVKSLGNCQIGPRIRRWRAALSVLMSDPVIRSTNLDELIDADLGNEEQKKEVLDKFGDLSSGHKIVLLTMTRLVESVEEKTLVLVDEIEAHLHPPLLSAFIRALSNLLVDRNGVAIIATHSPVVLQEVPRSCAWIINRSQDISKADRPTIETFGENLAVLSREVFQLELSQSGFLKLLEKTVEARDSYEEAVEDFDEQLGSEAKAVLRAMFTEKKHEHGK